MLTKILELKNHQGFRKYFINTSWLFAEQALRILSALFVGIWVARYLGPEQFGIFSYALAFTSIFAGVAKLGLDGILVRELVNTPEKRDFYLGTAFWLKVIGAFIVMGLIASILPFTSNDAITNIFIFIIAGGLVFQSFEVVGIYFQSQVLAKIVTICKVIQLTISSIIKIYLVLIEAELIWFVLFTSLDAFSLAISYAFAYQIKRDSVFYNFFDFQLAKQLLKDSWPLIFSSIVVMVYMRIDQLMIKEMLGEYEVGIYSVAVRLSEAFYFIPTLITTSLFPAILNAKNKDKDCYKLRLERLYSFVAWFAIAVALPMTFLSDWLILSLFGQVYQEAGQVLMVHIWASLFVFVGVASSKWYVAENLQKLSLVNTFVGALLNIILNIFFINKFGIIGAAYSTVISYASAAFLMNLVWSKSRPNFNMLCKGFVQPRFLK